MRSGSKASIYRRLVLAVLAIVVVGLVVVPIALAAGPSMILAGLVDAKYYKGEREMSATVNVPDPSSTTDPQAILATTRATEDGFFIMIVPGDGLETYYNAFTAVASPLGPGPIYPDWSGYFTTSPTPFDFIAGGAVGVSLNVIVKNTTISGTVKSAKTNKALKGVTVTIGTKSAKTSTKGKYSIVIGLWPVTRYKATFVLKGYKKASTSFTSAPGSGVLVNKSLK